MKLLLLSAANNIHTVRWANAMATKGIDTTVVCCNDHKVAENKFLDTVKVIYLKYKSGLGYYLNRKSLRKIVKSINPDIINVHYASGYGTLARISRLKNYLLSVWGSDVYDFPNESSLKKKILIKNFKYAPYIASTSNCMVKEIKKYTQKDIFITPFGVDTEIFKPSNNPKKENAFLFVTVKTLLPKYNIEGIINSFRVFIDMLSDDERSIAIKYYIYGKGERKENIENLIEKLKLQDYIFLKGYVPNIELPNVINECDVFLLKSILDSESFGVAAVEAMACQKPVIASDVDGFKEVIENDVSGIIIERNDVNGYVNAMYKLFKDHNLREKIGNNARQRVIDLFNWDDNVNKMISYYEVVINATKKG